MFEDDMLSTLLELLEEKGIISEKEFEEKMKMRIAKSATTKSYRAIQLGKADM